MQKEYTEHSEVTQAETIHSDEWMDRIPLTEGTLTRSQDREARHQRALDLRTAKIASSKDVIACGRGRKDYFVVVDRAAMDARPGGGGPTLFRQQTYQVPGSYETWIGTLEDLHREIVIGESGRGPKHQAVTIHAGAPLEERGPPSKANCGPSHILTLDLDDGALRDQRDLARLREWLLVHQLGYSLYSTASYSPETPKIRLILLWDIALAYDEHRIAARRMLARIQAHIGTDQGWDKCSTVPSHPMHVARWTSEEAQKVAIQEFVHGRSWPVSLELEAIREEIKEAKIAEEARIASFSAAGDLTKAIPLEDRISEARHEIHTSGLSSIRPGEGRTDSGMWDAARVCASWGLDADQIEAVLVSLFGAVDSKILSHKAAEAGRLVRPWRLLKAAGQRRARLEDEDPLLCDEAEFGRISHFVPGLPLIKEEQDPGQTTQDPGQSGRSSGGPVQVNERYLPQLQEFRDLPAKITAIKSVHGTGKNARLIPAWKRVRESGQMGVLVSHRQSLSRASADVAWIACYQDVDGQIEVPVSICWDSLGRVAEYTEDADGFLQDLPLEVLGLDEWSQVIRHAFSSTMRRSGRTRPTLLAARRLSANAKRILVQDADLSKWSLRCLRTLLGHSQEDEEIIINEWRPENFEVQLFEGAKGRTSLLGEMWEAAETSKIWSPCSSAEMSKALAAQARERFPSKKVLEVSSDNSGDPEYLRCLENGCEGFDSYDMVFASPVISSGVSVTASGWHVFGFSASGDGPIADDFVQALRRIRNPEGPVRVSVQSGPGYRQGKTTSEGQLEDLTILSRKTIEALDEIQDIVGRTGDYVDAQGVRRVSVDDPWILSIYAEVRAAEARGSHLHRYEDGSAGELEKSLKRAGARVEIIDCADTSDEDVAAQKAALKEAKEAVHNAEDALTMRYADEEMTSEERDLLAKQPRTKEISARIRAHDVSRFYGQKTVSRDLLKRDERGRRQQQVRALQHVRAVQKGHGKKVKALDAKAISGGKDGMPSIVGCSNVWLQARMRAKLLALWGFEDLDEAIKSSKVLQFPKGEVPYAVRTELRRVFGMSAGPALTWQTLARTIFASMGLATQSKRIRKGEDRVREMRVSEDDFDLLSEDGAAYWERLTGEEAPGWEPAPLDGEAMIEALLD